MLLKKHKEEEMHVQYLLKKSTYKWTPTVALKHMSNLT